MPASSLRRAMLIFLRPCTVPKQWQHVLKIVQNARFVQKFLSALPLRPKAELQRTWKGASWDVPATRFSQATQARPSEVGLQHLNPSCIHLFKRDDGAGHFIIILIPFAGVSPSRDAWRIGSVYRRHCRHPPLSCRVWSTIPHGNCTATWSWMPQGSRGSLVQCSRTFMMGFGSQPKSRWGGPHQLRVLSRQSLIVVSKFKAVWSFIQILIQSKVI